MLWFFDVFCSILLLGFCLEEVVSLFGGILWFLLEVVLILGDQKGLVEEVALRTSSKILILPIWLFQAIRWSLDLEPLGAFAVVCDSLRSRNVKRTRVGSIFSVQVL